MVKPSPETDWMEPNMGLTCAQFLGDMNERLTKLKTSFLELADLAVESGAKAEDICNIASEAGYFTCCWCKENGCYPSDYLKDSSSFKRNAWDDQLSGKICDECLNEMETNETSKLEATKNIKKD